ncbi:MAG: NAD-dependent protein deacetylase [Pseudomonadota bacterium]
MHAATNDAQIEQLATFVESKKDLVILTGAGCSTDSGIPDYRDELGAWKQNQPIQHQDFLNLAESRKRYWARSMVGWRNFGTSKPNPAHYALAKLESAGIAKLLVTQNVDGLHQAAGSQQVVDLHGRLDEVVCLDCQHRYPRRTIQQWLTSHNPSYAERIAGPAPDGDAHLEGKFEDFNIPDCQNCGGILKPDVVFFGDNVPRDKVDHVFQEVQSCDGMLVVGTSLMVFSGFRFVRKAHELGIGIAAINLGKTRADDLFDCKISGSCSTTLDRLLSRMGRQDA